MANTTSARCEKFDTSDFAAKSGRDTRCKDVANANNAGLQATGSEQQAAGSFVGGLVANAMCRGLENSPDEPTQGQNEGAPCVGTRPAFCGENAELAANPSGTRLEGLGMPSGEGASLPPPGCSCWWEVEPDVGRMVDELPFRVDRIKALGNSVVPAQARQAFIELMGLNQ